MFFLKSPWETLSLMPNQQLQSTFQVLRVVVLQAAADNDMLDDVVHRRANGSLSFFVTLITFIPNEVYPHPVVNPPIAAAVVLVSAFKWWVAGTAPFL